ncbi:MAG: YdcF family protein [Candidatus Kapaibacterium sp.]
MRESSLPAYSERPWPTVRDHEPTLSVGAQSVGAQSGRRWKRILFALMLAAQVIGYIVLVQARYEGQGLTPIYFRFTTASDIISLLFHIAIIALLVAAIAKPSRIGRGRTVSVAILSGILLWLDFGVRRTPPEEFVPEAAVALLLAMFALLATLSTGSRFWLRPMRRVFRVVRKTISIAVLMVLFAFFYSFFFPTYSRIEDIASFNADAGVVLGAAVWSGLGRGERPSPALRERIELGYELLAAHAIPRIVVTGASAPGELAEAEVAKRVLLAHGVDPSKIIEETSSHTTLEQVRYLHDELFEKQGWTRFVIVSDQYHLARVCEMCKFNGLTAIGSPSRIHQPVLDLLYYRFRESMALLEYWLLGR